MEREYECYPFSFDYVQSVLLHDNDEEFITNICYSPTGYVIMYNPEKIYEINNICKSFNSLLL